jgi:molybdenum cofactor cytidylyltransferase
MPEWVGLLLAAGRGSRFDPTGQRAKLLQTLPDGEPVALASAKALLTSTPTVLAIVPGGQSAPARLLASLLADAGCTVLPCAASTFGMGHSLAAGVAASSDAAGWLVLPADMPWISAASCQQVVAALAAGASMAAPVHAGQRGHPVGFAARWRDDLLALHGDEGARELLKRGPLTFLTVDDPGVLRDIDTPDDLPAGLVSGAD